MLDAQWGGSAISITNAGGVFLQHLTLTHGDGTGNCPAWPGSCGGGIYATGSNLHVGQCIITNNVGGVNHGGSGGVHLSGVTHADVLTNTIRGNKANLSTYYGGGGGLTIDSYSAAVYVAANRIEDNRAGHMVGIGGGVYVWQSDVHLARNTIVSNTTGTNGWKGSGVYILSSRPVTLSNNLIARNTATYGGGVYVTRSGTPASQAVLVNNTIADNGNGGIVADRYAVLTITT